MKQGFIVLAILIIGLIVAVITKKAQPIIEPTSGAVEMKYDPQSGKMIPMIVNSNQIVNGNNEIKTYEQYELSDYR